MEKLLRLTRHPAGRAGLTLGLTVGFIAAFIGRVRRMLFLISFLIGSIAFWQHVVFSDIRPAIPPSLK